VICLDQLGPESAKSFPGQQLVHTPRQQAGVTEPPETVAPVAPRPSPGHAAPAGRAPQEIDYGRRGTGYIFGAFRPATGAAFTRPYARRTSANWVDFLEQVDGWVPADAETVYAIVDNLNVHRATDVLLFLLAHPRWEFVFQPKYAAYLNLIEPWWKILRSLALKGRRFETWAEVCAAVEAATAYWNAHRHPFIWGQRRRHRRRQSTEVRALPITWNRRRSRLQRPPGIAALPKAA
jgi:transposase